VGTRLLLASSAAGTVKLTSQSYRDGCARRIQKFRDEDAFGLCGWAFVEGNGHPRFRAVGFACQEAKNTDFKAQTLMLRFAAAPAMFRFLNSYHYELSTTGLIW
jgi:hypothetical protein